jgi:uncharacterized repeat protein (TIGR03806 family)
MPMPILVLILVLVFATPQGHTAPFRPEGLRFPLSAPTAAGLRVVRAFPNLSFERPVLMTSAPDTSRRLFVVEQKGKIKVFTQDESARETKTLVDLSSVLVYGGEMGLLGMAFSPDFARSREFYVSYTADNPRRLEVARLKVSSSDANRASLSSRRVVITIPKSNPQNTNHNGGMIAFGPDGYLYVGTGDGGGAGDTPNNSQNPAQLLGKLLRIDVRGQDSYRVPADNPFVGRSGVRPEIWTLGMRNPWRFSFDAATGALWVSDVGQNAWEEINVIKKGRNYGWRIFEANHDFKNPEGLVQSCPEPGSLRCFDKPLFEYKQLEGNRSITGGHVYRGSKIPGLFGRYIYGDYVSGRIWTLNSNGSQVLGNDLLGDVTPLTQSVSAFGVDNDGELYVISHNGTLGRIESSAGSGNATLPQTLSATGLFERDLSTLRPVAGLEEYKVNASLWSDGALKRRWIGLPATGKIAFQGRGAFGYPTGTVFVKHFEMQVGPSSLKRLETRVLFLHREGWRGYTYRWNADGRDARLINARETEELTIASNRARTTQTWTYPSRVDCLSCHAASVGFVLGASAPQLNGPGPDGQNQIAAWTAAGVFTDNPGDPARYDAFAEIGDASKPLAQRVRSYLSVNCVQCHSPQGVAPGNIDLRHTTPLESTNLVDVAPTQGDLGIGGARRIRSGDHRRSILWKRMESLDSSIRMPPLASSVQDKVALQTLSDWINGLD